MFRLKSLLSLAFVVGLAVPAQAADPVGIWLTGPDKNGKVAHVHATPCGPAFCGKIIRVFNASGQAVNAPTVGKRVFWDMTGGSGLFQGRAYVPAHDRNYNAKMQVTGNRMKVSGCFGPVCQSQVWTRVK